MTSWGDPLRIRSCLNSPNLLATDQAFYRLLNTQSSLDVAKATVQASANVGDLTHALTRRH